MIYEPGRDCDDIEDLDDFHAFRLKAVETSRLRIDATNDDVAALAAAYCDSSDTYDFEKQVDATGASRAMCFWSDTLMTGEQMKKAYDIALYGYGSNDFTNDEIQKIIDIFGNEPVYQCAREYTVCLYIHSSTIDEKTLERVKELKADESKVVAPHLLRIWYD